MIENRTLNVQLRTSNEKKMTMQAYHIEARLLKKPYNLSEV